MPIYEYECRSCGHQLEVFQKITEDDLKKCPNCGKDALGKLISATTFQLKGTGWYVTDIRDKGKPNATNKDTEEESKTGTAKNEAKDAGQAAHDKDAKAKDAKAKETKAKDTKAKDSTTSQTSN